MAWTKKYHIVALHLTRLARSITLFHVYRTIFSYDLSREFYREGYWFLKRHLFQGWDKNPPLCSFLLYFVFSRDGALLVLRANIYFSILYSHEVLRDLEYVVKLGFWTQEKLSHDHQMSQRQSHQVWRGMSLSVYTSINADEHLYSDEYFQGLSVKSEVRNWVVLIY